MNKILTIVMRSMVAFTWQHSTTQANLFIASANAAEVEIYTASYCSEVYQSELTCFGIQSSMSRKGDCWGNAPTESLWGSLKVGRLYGKRFSTLREVMDEVIDWLAFYNHSRLHSALNYVSPMQFEARWLAEQRKKSA